MPTEQQQQWLTDLADTPIQVRTVEIRGVQHTRAWVLRRHFDGVLRGGQTTTASEVAAEVGRAIATLDRLGVVDGGTQHEVMLDHSPLDQPDPGDDAQPLVVNVVVSVVERPRLVLKAGTEVGMDDGSLSLSATVRNLRGVAETLQLTASKGTRTRSAFLLALSKPLNVDPRSIIDIAAFQNHADWSVPSSYSNEQTGAYIRYSARSSASNHSNTFAYDVVWRHIGNLADRASIQIRESAGDSIKSSISHTFTRDSRDDPFLPTNGSFIKLFSEYAGIGQGVHYVKSELDSLIAHRLPRGFSLSASFRAGMLYSLDGKPSNLNDRFFAGGVTSVRGFLTRGIGPRAVEIANQNGDALGGDGYWSSGLSLLTPIPFMKDYSAFKGHFFVNAGSLFSIQSSGVDRLLTQIQDKIVHAPISAVVGAGIVLRTHFCRLEANITHPLSMCSSDQLAPRVQLGIGMQFL